MLWNSGPGIFPKHYVCKPTSCLYRASAVSTTMPSRRCSSISHPRVMQTKLPVHTFFSTSRVCITYSLSEEAFKSDLGQFAGKHIDARDSPGGVTTMITLHKLEPDEDPGFFMIAGLGVAIGSRFPLYPSFHGLLHHGSNYCSQNKAV